MFKVLSIAGLMLAATAGQVQASFLVSEAGYTQVYGLAIPNTSTGWNSNAIPYSLNVANTISNGSFSRIAYYMEVQRSGQQLQAVWVSMNAFTNVASQIGVPARNGTNGNGGISFQQNLANMNVLSNVAGIVTGNGIATGNIEFWSFDYQTSNATGVPGANNGLYDFGDQNLLGSNYGSMQIHNHGAGQTLFALNRWGASSGNMDLGLGNQVGGSHPDWTFASNANQYVVKNLAVLVNGQTVAVPEPTSIAMLGTGALGLLFAARKRRQAKLGA